MPGHGIVTMPDHDREPGHEITWAYKDNDVSRMQCRAGCGACCIAPSISSPIPGMPGGKPAGTRCVHLTAENLCGIFERNDRPPVCGALKPGKEMCGDTFEEAYVRLESLEQATRPD
jgi:uncharacterized protein